MLGMASSLFRNSFKIKRAGQERPPYPGRSRVCSENVTGIILLLLEVCQ